MEVICDLRLENDNMGTCNFEPYTFNYKTLNHMRVHPFIYLEETTETSAGEQG